jgi:hypothetical protein
MKTFHSAMDPKVSVILDRLRQSADQEGFALIPGGILSDCLSDPDFKDFLRLIERMPADVYDQASTRKRLVTYAHYYKPSDYDESLIYFRKPKYDGEVGADLFTYQLPAKFNNENSDKRKFAPVPDAVLENPIFHLLIEAGYHAAPLHAEYRNSPLEVEVQFIRYEPRRNVASLGTPPTTHQDNDWAFCVFLLEWENVDGPENAFVSLEYANTRLQDVPEQYLLSRAFLTAPLEGYCVADTKVAHYVGPVSLARGSEYGRRTILILSYKPLIPLTPAAVEASSDLKKFYDKNSAGIDETPQPPESISLPEKDSQRDGAMRGDEVSQVSDSASVVFHRSMF